MIHLGYDTEKLYDDKIVPILNPFFHYTSALRINPSFFIIGVQKGGTSTLFYYLQQHPEIITPQRKDIYFFNNTLNYNKGKDWYKAFFAQKLYKYFYDKKNKVNAITFDSTPNYFDAPEATERIHKYYPSAKLILLLRNPIHRAYSCYQMARKFGFEHLSFEEALALEEQRLEQEHKFAPSYPYHSYVYTRLTYKKRGVYINFIKNWKELFGDNLLVLKSEDLRSAKKEQLNIISNFLGLNPYNDFDFEEKNLGIYEKKINPDTYNMLKSFYEPYNKKLYEYLGRDMGWE